MDDFEREMKQSFLEDAAQLLAEAEQCFLGLEKRDSSQFDKLFRLAHNLKGSSATFGLEDFAKLTHQLESLITRLKKNEIPLDDITINLLLACNDRLLTMVKETRANLEARFNNEDLLSQISKLLNTEEVASPKQHEPTITEPISTPAQTVAPTSSSETIRVSLARLDQIINCVGELLIIQSTLAHEGEALKSIRIQRTLAELEKITREVRQVSMSLRMVPLKQTFQKMQRIVRDTSSELGKTIALETRGEETELDKTIVEQLGDPLVHLIRNAVDHGLEDTAERTKAGKAETGKIILSASQENGYATIEVRDDGRGMDPRKLAAKATEKGLITPEVAEKMSDTDAYQLIFAPGFSTKTEVSAISGRGVGMDVVKSHIQNLRGTIQIETSVGVGTCFKICLPLSLGIIDGMVVRVGTDRFILPLLSMQESVSVKDRNSGKIQVRGEEVPVFPLGSLLGMENKEVATEPTAIVMKDAKGRLFSVLVDEVVHNQQAVLKPLGPEVPTHSGITGGALLGDGKPALILDLPRIVEVAV
jgi:two-component system chemotaxis sensor kinase CheA